MILLILAILKLLINHLSSLISTIKISFVMISIPPTFIHLYLLHAHLLFYKTNHDYEHKLVILLINHCYLSFRISLFYYQIMGSTQDLNFMHQHQSSHYLNY